MAIRNNCNSPSQLFGGASFLGNRTQSHGRSGVPCWRVSWWGPTSLCLSCPWLTRAVGCSAEAPVEGSGHLADDGAQARCSPRLARLAPRSASSASVEVKSTLFCVCANVCRHAHTRAEVSPWRLPDFVVDLKRRRDGLKEAMLFVSVSQTCWGK